MQRQAVESSMISAVGYDPSHRLLEIEFTSGRVYQYSDVPKDVFDDLMSADSKGRFFLGYIEGVYLYRKVR